MAAKKPVKKETPEARARRIINDTTWYNPTSAAGIDLDQLAELIKDEIQAAVNAESECEN